jgi:hypothetical protein
LFVGRGLNLTRAKEKLALRVVYPTQYPPELDAVAAHCVSSEADAVMRIHGVSWKKERSRSEDYGRAENTGAPVG